MKAALLTDNDVVLVLTLHEAQCLLMAASMGAEEARQVHGGRGDNALKRILGGLRNQTDKAHKAPDWMRV